MSNLQTYYNYELDFQKVDQNTKDTFEIPHQISCWYFERYNFTQTWNFKCSSILELINIF